MTPQAFREEVSYTQRWVPAFLHFLSVLKVTSKEMAEPGPITPYESQLRFLRELDTGLSEGQHYFVCLKSRQLGISTFLLALDIFWLFMFPGLRGALIADNDENRDAFRDTITEMLDSLPFGFKIGYKRNNRKALTLDNGSTLYYLAAGKGKNPDLGRSKGLSFVHGTETSSWGDQDGLRSLIDALAVTNPNRLYCFESTAKGFNTFNSMYEEAKRSPDQRAIFIGWWAKHLNRIAASHVEFQRWWGANPVLTEQETAMSLLIEQDYGVTLQPEQWAWWRYQLSTRTLQNLLQEHPWHESVAWQQTGSSFFNIERINGDISLLRQGLVTYDGYRYELGDKFITMRCDKVMDAAMADLKIYEAPVRNARYAIGVDVAFGRSATNDRHSIQVFRCFADKMVQAAEWTTSLPETFQVAWVLAHLAGSYRDNMINLETNGPGIEIITQMRLIRQDIEFSHLVPGLTPTFDARRALDQARWYIFHRPDTPGAGYLLNWRTNADNKQQMFAGFRDAYSTNQLIIRSAALLDEMMTLRQNGQSIGAQIGKKDDRPFAAGLACHAWRDWIRLNMLQQGRTYEVEMRKQADVERAGGRVIEGIVPQWFAQQERLRNEARRAELLGDYQ